MIHRIGWLILGFLALMPALAHGTGVIVAAGGGYEGDQGDTTAWSYTLYRELVLNGDVNDDGQVTVAILSAANETSWLPNYFKWLGATDAFNVKVSNTSEANDPANVDRVATADVIFIKGGDQGVYYDEWNDTLLETHIRTVVEEHNGAIGGTSAGAMSLAQFCFAPGKDMVSLDVLTDAQTNYLNDADGGSGIHTDFFGFVGNAVIDTHYTSRARLGRMLGILGKAVEESGNKGILAIGIEERTGIVIRDGKARVIGVGSVDFVRQTASTQLRRDARRPLFYTNLRLDRLTEGWQFQLGSATVDTTTHPSSALPVSYAGDGDSNDGSLTIHGSDVNDEGRFEGKIDYAPRAYATHEGTYTTFINHSLGIVDAYDSDRRASIQESIFRALYDYPAFTAFLVADSGQLYRGSNRPDLVQFQKNSEASYPEAATILIDPKEMTYKDLSPYDSNLDNGSHTLKAAALLNLKVHVLAETSKRRAWYSSYTHNVLGFKFP